jgi:hypothetical protein
MQIGLEMIQNLKEVIILIDRREEIINVLSTIEENRIWKIPNDFEEALWSSVSQLARNKVQVRVVSCVDQMLNGESLNISLRCNPCEYLRFGA